MVALPRERGGVSGRGKRRTVVERKVVKRTSVSRDRRRNVIEYVIFL